MHAYVINLARSLDRRAHITAELKKAGLDYEIVTAVDGLELDLGDPAIVDPSLPFVASASAGGDPGLAAGTAGCSLSHLNAYRKMIADGRDEALILEDDVVLPADVNRLAGVVAAQMSGAEVALLSVDSRDPCRLGRESAVALPSKRLLALPIDVSQPRSSAAYIITREACERMVKSMPPVRVQADGWWFFYREGLLDRVRCVFPMPVRKHPKFSSEIGSYSLGSGVRARLAKPLIRRRIPVLHQALTYRRQRIYRQWGRSEITDRPFVEKPSRLD